jgi:RNA polymerase sigma-32 factor
MNHMSNDAFCGKHFIPTPGQALVPETEEECFVPGQGNTTPTTPQIVGKPGPRPGRVGDFAGDNDEGGQAYDSTLMSKIEEARDLPKLVDNIEAEDAEDREPSRANFNHVAALRDKIMGIANLKRSEETSLFTRWRKDGDLQARNRLIFAHQKLVWGRAQKYRHIAPIDELFSVGIIGLIGAIDAFDHKRGARLCTYAIKWIDGELKEHLKQGLGAINQLRQREKAVQDAGKAWTDGPLSLVPKAVSLDTRLNIGEEDGDTWQDWLMAEGTDAILVEKDNLAQLQRHEEAIGDMLEMSRRSEILREVVEGTLEGRDLQIFQARNFLDEPLTYEELSNELGISRERVRQLDIRALEKVQKAISANPRAQKMIEPQDQRLRQQPRAQKQDLSAEKATSLNRLRGKKR